MPRKSPQPEARQPNLIEQVLLQSEMAIRTNWLQDLQRHNAPAEFVSDEFRQQIEAHNRILSLFALSGVTDVPEALCFNRYRRTIYGIAEQMGLEIHDEEFEAFEHDHHQDGIEAAKEVVN